MSWYPNFSDYLDSLVLNLPEESVGIIIKIKHDLQFQIFMNLDPNTCINHILTPKLSGI